MILNRLITEVGVLSSNGILVGSGAVESGRAVISIWSDNLMTKDTDGAKDGEDLYLNLWKKKDKEEINLTIEFRCRLASGAAIL